MCVCVFQRFERVNIWSAEMLMMLYCIKRIRSDLSVIRDIQNELSSHSSAHSFCPSVVSLLPDSISPLLFSHVTFSWEELNPVLPWAQLVLMCKCSLNPVLTRTTVLQGQSVRALLSVICRCFLLLWQSTDINNLGYHNSKHQMTNKPCLTCGTVGSAHAHNT